MSMGEIADLFASMMENVHTAIPATVVSIDGARVCVRPSLGMMLENGQKISIPDLEDVPLLMIGSNGFVLDIELDEGDPLLLIVLSADARKWIVASDWKEPVEAASPLRHALGGCVAIPLCRASGTQSSRISIASNGDITLTPKSGVLNVDGQIKASGEVTANCKSKPVKLSTHVHPTGVGPTSPPTPSA